jgi:glycosyltransferase involved in cell wall biosynthesis
MPEHTNGLRKQLYAKGMFAMLKRKADAILCVSNFTRDELIRFTGQGPQNIYLTYLGIDDSWFHIEKQQRPHPRPFLLFVGNVKPHKNLKTLLKAFELIKNQIPHDLLIVGQREGFITGDQLIGAKAVALGKRVQFTGYVEDKLLRQYFAHADVLVLPSLYEGFGLPPLEAMACGCPAVVASAAALPEICGGAALYCNPYSPRDIADKIRQLVNDPNLREDLRRKGVERAKQFTWNKCAEQTADVIELVVDTGA